MRQIKIYVDGIEEELADAKKYAESYLYCKAMGKSSFASKYKTMAADELTHADNLHTMAVEEITKLGTTYAAPESMRQAWEHTHNTYVERTAWLKKMLEM